MDDRCAVEGCEKPKGTRGWCQKHYHRWQKHGDPTKTLSPTRVYGTVEDRFWAKVLPPNEHGCMFWGASLDKGGYGNFKGGGRQGGAHRFAYEFSIGTIPDGMQLDHKCHTADISCPGGTECQHRRCVNPQHLEPVTYAENMRRGSAWEHNAKKTHCKYGHPYDEKNTRYTKGKSGIQRACKKCDCRRQMERRDRMKSDI